MRPHQRISARERHTTAGELVAHPGCRITAIEAYDRLRDDGHLVVEWQ
jgi:hypothetical protein